MADKLFSWDLGEISDPEDYLRQRQRVVQLVHDELCSRYGDDWHDKFVVTPSLQYYDETSLNARFKLEVRPRTITER